MRGRLHAPLRLCTVKLFGISFDIFGTNLSVLTPKNVLAAGLDSAVYILFALHCRVKHPLSPNALVSCGDYRPGQTPVVFPTVLYPPWAIEHLSTGLKSQP